MSRLARRMCSRTSTTSPPSTWSLAIRPTRTRSSSHGRSSPRPDDPSAAKPPRPGADRGAAGRGVKWAEGALDGVGGLRLYRQAWLPDADVRAIVVLVHGVSEHSGRYHHVAARLVADGYAVHALDHRGHGRSQGPRALIDRMDNAVADVHALVQATAPAHPDVPVVMLGHSM